MKVGVFVSVFVLFVDQGQVFCGSVLFSRPRREHIEQ